MSRQSFGPTSLIVCALVAFLSILLPVPTSAQSSNTLCTGTPTADVVFDVTSKMSKASPGVKVYQLTGMNKTGQAIRDRNGKVIANYITNVDVVNYTALNPPSFVVNSTGVLIKTIRADHTGAQIASALFGLHLRVSMDGTLVAQAGNHNAQPGDNSGGTDIFVTNLAATGACTSQWITSQHFTPAVGGGASGIPLTNPSWDSSVGLYLIAYAPGGPNSSLPPNVYTAYSDGKTATPYTPMEPLDSCLGFLYHKTRMDFTWPYLVFLQRETNLPHINPVCGDLMDLRTGLTLEFGDGLPGQIYYNHDSQGLDGQIFLMEASQATGGMAYTTLIDSSGNFIPGSNAPQSILNPSGYVIINPQNQAEWCTAQPNNKAICTSGPGSSTGGFPKLPTGCYPAYTIDLATHATNFLACTDGYKTSAYEGESAIRFFYQSADGNYHALFRSDKTGTPQVYELVYAP